MTRVARPVAIMSTGCRRQNGVALLTVLLIVFLVSAAAASLASVQQLAIRRSAVLLHQQQARLYTLGGELWAISILKRDRQESESDSLDEDWANMPPSLPVQGGTVSGRIEDLQGRFNLNNLLKPTNLPAAEQQDENDQQDETSDETENGDLELDADKDRKKAKRAEKGDSDDTKEGIIDPEQVNLLKRMLEVLEINPDIVQAIVDWIDSNEDTGFPDGAEDSEYTVRNPSYLSANRPMMSVSELRLIKGIDNETYEKLYPYVCTLPAGTRINVNTIVAPLLAALADTADLAEAKTVVEKLKTEGFATVAEFLTAAGITPRPEYENMLSVNSNFFMLRIEAQVGEGVATLASVLQRKDDGNVLVLRRNFGNET